MPAWSPEPVPLPIALVAVAVSDAPSSAVAALRATESGFRVNVIVETVELVSVYVMEPLDGFELEPRTKVAVVELDAGVVARAAPVPLHALAAPFVPVQFTTVPGCHVPGRAALPPAAAEAEAVPASVVHVTVPAAANAAGAATVATREASNAALTPTLIAFRVMFKSVDLL